MSTLPKAIVMMGKPGSGKSTQAALIADKLGYKKFSTGDAFRTIASGGGVMGKRVGEIMNSGGLMPVWFATYLLQKSLLELGDEERIVFEGVGRKLKEAELFDEIMEFVGWNHKIFYLNLPDATSANRIVNRKERADDTAEIAKKRIEKYHEFTDLAVQYFRSKKKLIEIDASLSPEEVFEQIERHLK